MTLLKKIVASLTLSGRGIIGMQEHDPFQPSFLKKEKKKEKKSSSHIHLPNWEENKHDIISISTSTSSFRSSQGTFTIFNNILLKSKLRDWLGLLKNLKNTIIEECQDHCIFLWGSNL